MKLFRVCISFPNKVFVSESEISEGNRFLKSETVSSRFPVGSENSKIATLAAQICVVNKHRKATSISCSRRAVRSSQDLGSASPGGGAAIGCDHARTSELQGYNLWAVYSTEVTSRGVTDLIVWRRAPKRTRLAAVRKKRTCRCRRTQA